MSFKRSSDTLAISFSATESAPGIYTEDQINLSLNPLDNEIFVVLAVDLNVDSPDAIAGINTATRAAVSSTSLAAMGKLSDSNVLAVAQEAINRKSGARGLRAILEDVMLDIMYDIPSQENVKECVVSKDVILKREKPLILYENKTKSA